jgi:MFS transporter, NNP family, nitrate/nitrite transporter
LFERSARARPGRSLFQRRNVGAPNSKYWRVNLSYVKQENLAKPGAYAEPTAPDAASARRVLVLSTAAFTLLFAVWLMLGVLALPIQQELGLSKLQLTWLTAIAILSGSIFRLPFGLAADRFGGKVVLTALLVVSAVPCYLLSTADSFDSALVYALLFGIGGNSFSVGIAWNSAWSTRERQGFALGTFGAGNVGASVTKLIGPTLIAIVPAAGLLGGAIPGGWRFVPVLYTGFLLVAAVLVWVLSPRVDRMPGAGRTLTAMMRPLRELRVWRFGLYYVVVFGAYVALSLWLPNYYRSVYGLELKTAAFLTALFIFPASLLRPLGGYLSDRYGARPVTYVVFALMMLACVPLCAPSGALGFEVGPALFFALVEVIGVGMGIGKASVYKYVPEYYPKDVGLVGGLVGTLGALGGFFLPLGFGYLEAATGRPEACFWIMIVLIASSFGWLHLVVKAMRGSVLRIAPAATSASDGGRELERSRS